MLNNDKIANISFLIETQDFITFASLDKHDVLNAHANFMTIKYWIEIVKY